MLKLGEMIRMLFEPTSCYRRDVSYWILTAVSSDKVERFSDTDMILSGMFLFTRPLSGKFAHRLKDMLNIS